MRITILDVLEGVCEVSGKQGEIEMDDPPARAAVSFKALAEMARFRARQAAKNSRAAGPATEKG